jgi:hypothetical protein
MPAISICRYNIIPVLTCLPFGLSNVSLLTGVVKLLVGYNSTVTIKFKFDKMSNGSSVVGIL